MNSNTQNGINIALLVEFGHASVNGTWVEGISYIEPVVRDSYNEVLSKTWKELNKL